MKEFTLKRGWNRNKHLFKVVLGWDWADLETDYKSLKMKKDISEKDYFWGLLNRMLVRSDDDTQNIHSLNKSIYLTMAWFVHWYEGKSGLPYSRLMIQAEIMDCKFGHIPNSHVMYEIAVIPDPECTYARSLKDTRYPIDVDDIPLATNDCLRPVCRCCLSVVPKRDENGRLVFKNRPSNGELVTKVPERIGFWAMVRKMLGKNNKTNP
ncbi:hypothetical protein [Robiginitalea sediminis]|uniref:hypothetical protein n=1 Tax=Robiginitalea sediminis TaxID=1982593 RepID=UPI000B4A7D83|nr:hypothetical protein [Robiginitalea sediminis]